MKNDFIIISLESTIHRVVRVVRFTTEFSKTRFIAGPIQAFFWGIRSIK